MVITGVPEPVERDKNHIIGIRDNAPDAIHASGGFIHYSFTPFLVAGPAHRNNIPFSCVHYMCNMLGQRGSQLYRFTTGSLNDAERCF